MTELSVAVVIMGVLIAYAIPRFQKAFEQARVDMAATNLQTIWTAQRLYWAQNRTYAPTITDLSNSNLLDPSFVTSLASLNNPFTYTIDSADASSFRSSADRVRSTNWSGELEIMEDGQVTGQINGGGGEVVRPSPLLL